MQEVVDLNISHFFRSADTTGLELYYVNYLIVFQTYLSQLHAFFLTPIIITATGQRIKTADPAI